MKREARSFQKIDDDIKTAGKSFLGLRMEDMLLRVKELEDIEKKKDLVEEYFENQVGTHDSVIRGMRTRVDAVIRIIKADAAIYALDKVNGDPRIMPEAIEKAAETRKKIQNGEIPLPDLK